MKEYNVRVALSPPYYYIYYIQAIRYPYITPHFVSLYADDSLLSQIPPNQNHFRYNNLKGLVRCKFTRFCAQLPLNEIWCSGLKEAKKKSPWNMDLKELFNILENILFRFLASQRYQSSHLNSQQENKRINSKIFCFKDLKLFISCSIY